MCTIAVMQPTYLPWIGYFGMIDMADVFIFYDDVQFVKQSWQQRNRIKTQDGWIWLVVPVFQNFGQKINQVKINNNQNWPKKHWKSIQYNYSKAPFFNEYMAFIEEIYEKEWDYLADLNITLIKRISEFLGLDTEFMLSSELRGVEGTKTDRLINILKLIGADEYLTAPATKAYIEPEKFKGNDIMLYWYEFNHPTYKQLYGDFVPHLSVIDLLFNTGGESINVIREGEENAVKEHDSVIYRD
jgi:hypothetical protein